MRNIIESRPARIIALSTTLSLGAMGCGEQKSNGDQRAAEIRKQSQTYKGIKSVPQELCQNTNHQPQLPYAQNPIRLIVNSLCQPPIGSPVGLYDKPTFAGTKVGEVWDGDIVVAECIDVNGQTTTNNTGDRSASQIWVKIMVGQETGFVSEVNLGYVNDADFKQC